MIIEVDPCIRIPGIYMLSHLLCVQWNETTLTREPLCRVPSSCLLLDVLTVEDCYMEKKKCERDWGRTGTGQ